MADIDVSAQGLAVPPSSAPQTIYVPALSVKNEGIHSRVATGYLRIWDKVAGTLLATHQIRSVELAPGETNAAASIDGTWDLTDVEPGTQFLVDGLVTCDGDQVSSNNPQGPVTVTVSDAEPPPPPPVVSHASQHEEGGSDKIDVTGLQGQLADAQPVSDHASSHEYDGTDELNVTDLEGELAAPQPPKVHDNAEHSTDYAAEAFVTAAVASHNNAVEPHQGTNNLEYVARKNTDNGYCGLNAGGVVPALRLGFKTGPDVHGCNLNGNEIWSAPVGGCVSTNVLAVAPGAGEVALGQLLTGQFWIEGALGEVSFGARIFGRVNGLVPGDTCTLRIYAWPTAGGAIPALHAVTWTAKPTDNDVMLNTTLRATFDPTNNNIVGQGCCLALDVAGGPNAESHAMPAETLSAWWNPTQELTVYTTVQVIGAGIAGHNFNSNLVINHLMEYLT